MTGPRILFVVNAGPEVGGGHVMRSLTLARALEGQGAAFAFLGPPAAAQVLEAFAPGVSCTVAGDLAGAAALESFDAIVFDHYGLAEADHRAMAGSRPALVIDDLADRPLGADIVLDSGPGRRAEDYLGKAPEAARLLLGPSFAPVRPEFAALRAAALAWRGEPVQRILVSMGLTDVGGVTARIVERIRPRIGGDIGLDVVLGAAAPSLPGLEKQARRDPRLLVHVDTPHMARLTAEADIGIGAPGSTTWERCTLGLPSVLVILADNQRPASRTLAEAGAALVVDLDPAFEDAFDRALLRLLRDSQARRELAIRSSEICDGLGAGRTAETFLRLVAARRG